MENFQFFSGKFDFFKQRKKSLPHPLIKKRVGSSQGSEKIANLSSDDTSTHRCQQTRLINPSPIGTTCLTYSTKGGVTSPPSNFKSERQAQLLRRRWPAAPAGLPMGGAGSLTDGGSQVDDGATVASWRDMGNDLPRTWDGRREDKTTMPDLVGLDAEEVGVGRSRWRCVVRGRGHGRARSPGSVSVTGLHESVT
jgi:hypothetical protein